MRSKLAETLTWGRLRHLSRSSLLRTWQPTTFTTPTRLVSTTASLPAMEIRMPSLSPTMTEGTIVEWHKKEGDSIAPGDVLCDIQTDKAVMGFELEEEGVLAKILVPGDAKNVQIGDLIAIIAEQGEDIDSIVASSAPVAATSAVTAESGVALESSPADGAPAVGTVINMPSLSPTMYEGTIVEWLKKEGDQINPGDILCEIQTDKAVVGFELEEEGFLAKILIGPDAKVIPIGRPIAVIVEDAADIAKAAASAVAAKPSAATPPAATPAASATTPTPKATVAAPAVPPTVVAAPAVATPEPAVYSSHIEKFGPAVRMLLQLYRLDEASIPRTGRKGWLLKEDVLTYIHTKKLMPQPPQAEPLPKMAAPVASSKPAAAAAAAIASVATPYQDIELTSMRKTIAKRLTESKTTIPHAYLVMDCLMDPVLSLRKSLKEKQNATVSVNDFIIKAAGAALTRVPAVNAVWDGAKGEGNCQSSVDISVAVATPGGLITPIVKDASGCGVQEIANRVRTLATKARDGKLQPHEFIGGSFSISNLGMFGVTEFSAVINPPQAAILAIGTSRLQPGVEGDIETMMKVTLSYDARMVDDDAAFQFLEAFRDAIENPMAMI